MFISVNLSILYQYSYKALSYIFFQKKYENNPT